MHDEITIGARLRALRRWRGMTLDQLAGQAGLSKSFLFMAERGQRALDRRSYISALATVLKVSEPDLVGGPHLGADPVQAEPHTFIPALRTALETLVEAYMCAAGMARALRHPDLGHVVAVRADETAVLLDDPVARGKAAFSLVRPSPSNWHRVKTMAERAADRLEPHVRDDAGRNVLGMLTLNAALAAPSFTPVNMRSIAPLTVRVMGMDALGRLAAELDAARMADQPA